MFASIRVRIAFVLMLTVPAIANAATIAIAWDANTESNIAGYTVAYGTSPGSYSTLVDVGKSLTYSPPTLTNGTLYYFAVRAYNTSAQVSPFSSEVNGVASAPGDTTLPAATVTAPTAGAQVSGSVTVSATATDNVAVTGVAFRIDGVAAGAEDMTAPYSFTWNTLSAANGSHALTAVARDTAGNLRTSAVVTVQVSNTTPPPPPPPPPPGSGLVAAYGFDEGTGTATADASGQGNPGTIAGAAWKPGKFGQSLEFDGSTAWVTVAANNSVNFAATMTVEAWIYPTEAGGWRSVVFKEAPGEIKDHNYGLYSAFGTLGAGGHVLLDGSADNVKAHDAAALVLNRWTHVATTYDGSVLRAYVDGVERMAVAATGPINVSAGVLRIGGNSIFGDFFKGQIDEVRLYNRALSPAEIGADMSSPIATPPASDTTPPATAIVAPAAGSQVSGSVGISATATDNVAVAGVAFRIDGVAAGVEDTTAPYSYTWNSVTAANGSHALTAVARDTSGNLRTSAVVTVQVLNSDTTLPVATVTAPAAGSQVSGSVAVTATATDNVAVAGVAFQIDGVAAGAEDTTAPYGFTWNSVNTSDGSHGLTVVARDTSGNLRTSAVVTVQVLNATPPPPPPPPPPPAGSGLVAAYGFDEGTGTATADASGQGNPGTIAGAVWKPGKFGQSLEFDGSTAWVTVAANNALNFAATMTVEAWIYPTEASGWRSVVFKEAPGEIRNHNYGLYSAFGAEGPGGHVLLDGFADNVKAHAPAALVLNRWTHVATTYDGSVLRAYVDGVERAAVAATGPINVSAGVLRMGGNSMYGDFFKGQIDEVRLYSRALSPAEIGADMSTPIDSGLVAAYGFEEGAGTVTADESGRGNAGVITGATWKTAGKFGKSLGFDGLSNWVTIAASASVNVTTALTVEAWVYPTEAAGWRSIVFKEAPGEIKLHSYALYSAFGVEGPGGHVLVAGQVNAHDPAEIVLNRWTHLAMTYDGSMVRAYVDGVERASAAATGPINLSGGALRIGGNGMWGDYFTGRIDEVRLYNRALSALQIQADMTTPVR